MEIKDEPPFDPLTCEKNEQGLPIIPWYLAQPYVRPPWVDPKEANKKKEKEEKAEQAEDKSE